MSPSVTCRPWDFSTNIDYIPFIDSLQENTIKGNLYVSVFGGGTCDSEYAFLTGNSTAYLPESKGPISFISRVRRPDSRQH